MNRQEKQQPPVTGKDPNPPKSVGEVIKDSKKTGAKSKKRKNAKTQKKWKNCPKCNKAYKNQDSLDNHVKECNGEHKGGMPKSPITEDKRLIAEQKIAMQRAIASHTNELVSAQLNMARGYSKLYMRTEYTEEIEKKNGKTEKRKRYEVNEVTSDTDYRIYLSLPHDKNGHAKSKELGVEFYYASFSGGDHRALANLLDRAFGKPKESVELGEDPDAPLPKGGTGSTTELAKAFRDFLMEKTKAPEVKDDTSD